ncbi:restriction endonuclease subunit S [Burkholderia cepacia]|uniref:restriction endonuclease subunit S n=1 Tax=Burkholderia cepacia TaxID=292 RepID=UPI0009BF36E6|nr:restriction endonuclease subunit S [Burkholderia cepacia]
MQSERTRVKLAELIRIKHGFAFKGEHFVDEPTPHVLVTPGNFAIGGGFQETKLKFYRGPVPEEYVLRAGDLVVTMTDLSRAADTLGYAALIPNDQKRTFLHNQRIGLVEVTQPAKVSRRWLHFLMRSAEYRAWVVGSATGSTVKHTSPSRICDYEFDLPDLEEQRRVASILDALDARIILLRQTNTTLESIAQVLFKSWFIDFDPVRAKAEGREPEGMDAEIAALFPSGFDESALGLVPVGWKPRAIEELAEKVGMGPFGSNIKVSTFVESGIPVLNGSCLKGTLLEEVDCKFITEQHAERLAGSLVRAGDIVITHRGTLGQVSLIAPDSGYPSYMLSQSQFYLRTNPEETTPEFMSYFLMSDAGQHLLLANAAQVGVPSISRPVTYLKSIRLAVPGIQVARAFADLVAPLHCRIILGRRQISVLGRLRDSLLPRLVSGKLRLPEAEAQLSEALA